MNYGTIAIGGLLLLYMMAMKCKYSNEIHGIELFPSGVRCFRQLALLFIIGIWSHDKVRNYIKKLRFKLAILQIC